MRTESSLPSPVPGAIADRRAGAGPDEAYTPARRSLLFVPPLVLLLVFDAFRGGATVFGVRWGYISGFLFYWAIWGLGFPLWVLGPSGVRALLLRPPRRGSVSPIIALPLLAGPPIIGFLFVFPMALPSLSAGTLVAFAIVAAVNGTLEEIVWRGLYATTFPRRRLAGFVIPAIWFALLQLAPLSAYPGRTLGAAALVVGGAFAVGLAYGWIAWRTGSIRWTIMSHVLMNFSGIGAIIYAFAR
jgi:CAAX protease family protein